MKTANIISQIIGYGSLVGLALSSILFLTGKIELAQTKQHIFIATIIWFITSGYNMWDQNQSQSAADK